MKEINLLIARAFVSPLPSAADIRRVGCTSFRMPESRHKQIQLCSRWTTTYSLTPPSLLHTESIKHRKMAGAREPYFKVAATNHAAWIVAVTITFLVYAMMGVMAKILYRLRLTAVKSYDWFVVSALLVAFAQSILLIRACVHGLGKHQAILSDPAFDSFRKACYDPVETRTILIFFRNTSLRLCS